MVSMKISFTCLKCTHLTCTLTECWQADSLSNLHNCQDKEHFQVFLPCSINACSLQSVQCHYNRNYKLCDKDTCSSQWLSLRSPSSGAGGHSIWWGLLSWPENSPSSPVLTLEEQGCWDLRIGRKTLMSWRRALPPDLTILQRLVSI